MAVMYSSCAACSNTTGHATTRSVPVSPLSKPPPTCSAACNGSPPRRRGLSDVVVPIALAVKRGQLAHELCHYKYDADATVRRRLEFRLAAVLWRFLEQHEAHVAEAVGVRQFGIVTTVPGTRQRDDEHPLVRIAGTLVGQSRRRWNSLSAKPCV